MKRENWRLWWVSNSESVAELKHICILPEDKHTVNEHEQSWLLRQLTTIVDEHVSDVIQARMFTHQDIFKFKQC